MGYQLGIDLGVTETTVAVVEGDWPALVSIGGSPTVPTVLYLGPDGTARGGRAAVRLARAEPTRYVARFVERLGDPAPILVGGVGFTASALVARYLTWLVDTVTRLRGSAPDLVVVTVPGTWPARRQEGLADALARVEADVALTVRPGAEALAALLTRSGRAAPGRYVGSFDLGTDWFEATVYAGMPAGFVVAGGPVGLSDVTTSMLDELLYAHVVNALGEAGEALRGGSGVHDPAARPSPESVALLAACASAREDLVEDDSAVIAVTVPGAATGDGGDDGGAPATTTVTVTRDEYEALVRPLVEDGVRALARAIRSVPAAPEDLSLLVVRGPGGRAALVARLLTESLGAVARREVHPDSDLALGAALLAAAESPAEAAGSQTVVLAPASYTTTPPPSIPPVAPVVSRPPAGSSPVDVPPGAALTDAALTDTALTDTALTGAALTDTALTDTEAVHAAGDPARSPGRQPSAPAGSRRPAALASTRRVIAAAIALALFVAGSVTLGLVLTDDSSDPAAITAQPTGPLPPSTIDQHPQLPADDMRKAEEAAGIAAGDAGSAGAQQAPDSPDTVIATGSAEVAPITGTAYAMFREAQKGVTVRVDTTDTDDGFAKLCGGQADIAGASFALTDPACKDKVVGFEIAHHLLPIVVSKENTWAQCLTTRQIGDLWKRDSTVTSWNQIDPSFPNEPLRLVGPSTRTVHAKVFLASMTGASDNTRRYREVELEEVPEEVEYDLGAIGFMDYSNFQTSGDGVRAIRLDSGNGYGCVEPNALTAGTGMYMPLCKPLYIYASRESLRKPAVAAFMNYYMENQKDVTFRAHFVARDDATVRDNTTIVRAMTAGVEPVRT